MPVLLSGTHLELNAAMKQGGGIVVDICDPAGKVLARSKTANGDDLRLRVSWENEPNLEKLAGKPVTLRFELKNAELFAFAFRR